MLFYISWWPNGIETLSALPAFVLTIDSLWPIWRHKLWLKAFQVVAFPSHYLSQYWPITNQTPNLQNYKSYKSKAILGDLSAANSLLIANENQIAFQPVCPCNFADELEKLYGTSFMLLKAKCVISSPCMNANWSCHLRTLKSSFFGPCVLEIWWMTLQNNGVLLLYHSFQALWIISLPSVKSNWS